MRVAFSGPFQSGKSTVADYLDETYDLAKWSFGDCVREALVEMGFDHHDMYSEPKATGVRQLLQALGHGARGVDVDFWVDKLLSEFDWTEAVDICVDDMRYANEATALKAAGFKLVKVVCPGLLEDGNGDRDHDSEHGLDLWDDWDATIYAVQGDVKSLYAQMDTLIATWEAE